MNPGSDEAIEAGCTCPALDNSRGRGSRGTPGIFVFNVGCQVHDEKWKQERQREKERVARDMARAYYGDPNE